MTEAQLDKAFEEAKKKIQKHIEEYAEASIFIMDHNHSKRMASIRIELDFKEKMGFPFYKANQNEKEYYYKYYATSLLKI